jgi:hypothetical protein
LLGMTTPDCWKAHKSASLGHSAVVSTLQLEKQRLQPRLGIEQSLFDLPPLEHITLDPRLLASDSLDGNGSLTGGQPPARAGFVGQEDGNKESDCDGEQAHEAVDPPVPTHQWVT